MARNLHKDPSITSKNDASCINNKRGMARRAKRNSNKRDRQSLTKETVDLSLEAEMGKFTQTELEEAYKQMQEERQQDNDRAKKALDWVKKALAMDRCTARIGSNGSYLSPYPIEFVLIFTHETYGPYKEDYIKILGTMPWATATPTAWISGFTPLEAWYKVTTPFGDYSLTFEYFDNHVGGY